jgi:hypothetical protein
MAVGRAVPRTVAGDVAALATTIAGETNISAAVVVPSVGEADVKRTHIKVTGTAVRDVLAAIDTNGANVAVGAASAGNFTITVDGQTTANIAYNAAASAVKSALEALSTVILATVSGTGSAADPWVCTVDDDGSERTITVADVDLTGGSLTVTTPIANVQILPGTTPA